MNDMAPTIVPKSDQLNSDDLITGPRTITVRDVQIDSNSEQPVAVYFHGDNGKPYMPGKSMRRAMVIVWGAEAAAYVGRSMTLYRDADVTFGGMKVGGTRISHMSHMGDAMTFVLTATKKTKKPFTVKPLAVAATQHQQAPVSPPPPSDGPSRVRYTEPKEKARAGADRLIARISACADVSALHDIAGNPAINRGRDRIKQDCPEADQEIADAMARRFAELGTIIPEPSPDPDLGLANAYLAEIAALETAMDVRAWAENGEIKQSMAAWRKDRPELFTAVDGAVAARITGAEDAA